MHQKQVLGIIKYNLAWLESSTKAADSFWEDRRFFQRLRRTGPVSAALRWMNQFHRINFLLHMWMRGFSLPQTSSFDFSLQSVFSSWSVLQLSDPVKFLGSWFVLYVLMSQHGPAANPPYQVTRAYVTASSCDRPIWPPRTHVLQSLLRCPSTSAAKTSISIPNPLESSADDLDFPIPVKKRPSKEGTKSKTGKHLQPAELFFNSVVALINVRLSRSMRNPL